MARRKALFAGGRRSVSAKATQSEGKSTKPIIDNSREALEQREAERKLLPVPELKGTIPTIDGRKPTIYKYDLTVIVNKYPHHERLITQLLAGMLMLVIGLGARAIDSLNRCILEFIAYLNDPKNLSNTNVSLVSEINVTVCQAYKTYLISQFPRRTANGSRFSLLRRIVHKLQEGFSHDPAIGPLLQWPVGLSGTSKPRQGYSSQAMGELVEACQRDIRETMDLHRMYVAAKEGETIRCTEWNLPNLMVYLMESLIKWRQRGVSAFLVRKFLCGSPNARKFLEVNGYAVEAIAGLYQTRGVELASKGHKPGKRLPSWTLENFMFWMHDRWKNESDTSTIIKNTIRYLIGKFPSAKEFLETNNYSENHIVELYRTRGEELAAMGRNPFGHKFSSKASDEGGERTFKLVLGTLAQNFPDYPFNMSLEQAQWFFGCKRYKETENKQLHTTVEGTVLSAINRMGTPHYQRSFKGPNLIRAAMHFLLDTLYPFVLLVQINTGWNLECIVALTDDVESHVTPDPIDPDNYVLIHSTKVRGQKKEPKVVSHRCSRHQQFSTYRLLKYVESVVTLYRGCRSYRPGRLWQYATRSGSQTVRLINYYCETTSDKHYGSRFFLRRHSLKYFTDKWVSHGRIRTSYETLREMQGLSLQAISQDLDHENEETTSDHYGSDSTSNAVKDVKIAEYQEQLVDQLRNYQCRLAESESLNQLREAIEKSHEDAEQKTKLAEAARSLGMDEKTLVHLLSPEGQTYIAVCRDSLNPTWDGHEEYLKKGQRCCFFNKCGGCTQAVIFREALPYIARREFDLEQLRAKSNQLEWLSNYGKEFDEWSGVLDDWSDQGAVERAREAAKRGEVMLPLRMRGPK